jgi:hypothetical protein
MPELLRIDGFTVMLYFRDHRPPHVHVFDADGQVIVNLALDGGRPTFREVRGMSAKGAVRALMLVHEHNERFPREWSMVHG